MTFVCSLINEIKSYPSYIRNLFSELFIFPSPTNSRLSVILREVLVAPTSLQ